MANRVKAAFEMQGVILPVEQIVPLKQMTDALRKSNKYVCIMNSIKEVGVVEPIVVFPCSKKSGKKREYYLLDGHFRLDALKQLGHTEVACLISIDDEGYTFNQKVNRLPPIQEHFMIMKAISSGVSEERIARALNVDVEQIKRKRNLIKGVCPEAVDLLKDRHVPASTLRVLSKVKGSRQIEIAERMINMNNFTASFAQALVMMTPNDQKIGSPNGKEAQQLKLEDVERMKRELDALEKDYKGIEQTYSDYVYNLMLAKGYIGKLLNNAKVVRYLSVRYGDILTEMNNLLET